MIYPIRGSALDPRPGGKPPRHLRRLHPRTPRDRLGSSGFFSKNRGEAIPSRPTWDCFPLREPFRSGEGGGVGGTERRRLCMCAKGNKHAMKKSLIPSWYFTIPIDQVGKMWHNCHGTRNENSEIVPLGAKRNSPNLFLGTNRGKGLKAFRR